MRKRNSRLVSSSKNNDAVASHITRNRKHKEKKVYSMIVFSEEKQLTQEEYTRMKNAGYKVTESEK